MLQIEGLVKRFGGLTAVDALDFAVHRGEILGLIGPNGSGKTTVMNLVSGVLATTAGSIRLDGIELSRMSAHRIARHGVARTFQLVRVLESMSCLENVLAGMAFCASPRFGGSASAQASALLARVGLAKRDDSAARDLAYIDRKRLELARVLASRPRLLLLDEWLAGLNPSELLEGVALLRELRNEGMTMVLVEHVMDAIRSLCDRCVVMNAGRKIADAPPREALSDPQVVRAYLGDENAHR